jgi:hypothetical protein
VPFGDVTLKVEAADSRRVAKVLATREKPPASVEGSNGNGSGSGSS